jgi:hypothetical protein
VVAGSGGDYEQAAAWRSVVLAHLRGSVHELERARDGSPTSVELVKIEHAIRIAREALKECERNLAVARRMAARQQRG